LNFGLRFFFALSAELAHCPFSGTATVARRCRPTMQEDKKEQVATLLKASKEDPEELFELVDVVGHG